MTKKCALYARVSTIGCIAELEADLIKERIKAGMRRRKLEGFDADGSASMSRQRRSRYWFGHNWQFTSQTISIDLQLDE